MIPCTAVVAGDILAADGQWIEILEFERREYAGKKGMRMMFSSLIESPGTDLVLNDHQPTAPTFVRCKVKTQYPAGEVAAVLFLQDAVRVINMGNR